MGTPRRAPPGVPAGPGGSLQRQPAVETATAWMPVDSRGLGLRHKAQVPGLARGRHCPHSLMPLPAEGQQPPWRSRTLPRVPVATPRRVAWRTLQGDDRPQSPPRAPLCAVGAWARCPWGHSRPRCGSDGGQPRHPRPARDMQHGHAGKASCIEAGRCGEREDGW
jgi:hypothetical protein